MGHHHHSHSQTRSRSRSRSRSDHHRHHYRRSRSHHSHHTSHLSKSQWNELKEKSKFGHTDTNNRFGDEELDKPFIWKKKENNEQDRVNEKQLVLKRLENREEILKAQARRQEHEERKLMKQKKYEKEEELKEQEEMEASIEKEKNFHLTQKLIGMRIRIKSGREKPVDCLLKNILLTDDINKPVNTFDNTVLDSTIKEEERPVEEIINELNYDESTELLKDLDEILLLPEMEPFLTYIAAVRAVVMEHLGDNDVDEQAMHESVINDVQNLIEGKSLDEIKQLQDEINSQLANEAGMDVDYWTAVLSLLRLASFKETLRLEQERFKLGRNIEKQRLLEEERAKLAKKHQWRHITEDEAIEHEFSPDPIPRSSLTALYDVHIVEAVDDIKELQMERDMVRHRELEDLTCKILETKHGVSAVEHVDHVASIAFDNEVEYAPSYNELQEDETEIKDDVMLSHQSFTWQHKYTPRKPIFFNKVKSGYDWNQFNQTHYDLKNPPPKVVQGYSFNLFYPDLVDKTNRPSFTVEPDVKDPNWCFIRFHAGAPYEDVAFRIVNRAWDRGRKSRFRNDFERGVLHLYFDFKKYQYNAAYICLLLTKFELINNSRSI